MSRREMDPATERGVFDIEIWSVESRDLGGEAPVMFMHETRWRKINKRQKEI
jgi:hypothetical protein